MAVVLQDGHAYLVYQYTSSGGGTLSAPETMGCYNTRLEATRHATTEVLRLKGQHGQFVRSKEKGPAPWTWEVYLGGQNKETRVISVSQLSCSKEFAPQGQNNDDEQRDEFVIPKTKQNRVSWSPTRDPNRRRAAAGATKARRSVALGEELSNQETDIDIAINEPEVPRRKAKHWSLKEYHEHLKHSSMGPGSDVNMGRQSPVRIPERRFDTHEPAFSHAQEERILQLMDVAIARGLRTHRSSDELHPAFQEPRMAKPLRMEIQDPVQTRELSHVFSQMYRKIRRLHLSVAERRMEDEEEREKESLQKMLRAQGIPRGRRENRMTY